MNNVYLVLIKSDHKSYDIGFRITEPDERVEVLKAHFLKMHIF